MMNEENEWDHKVSGGVKEGPADCIRMAEVRAVLKKMKRHKAPGLSGLVAEMIQAAGDTGTQWLLDLCKLNSKITTGQSALSKDVTKKC